MTSSLLGNLKAAAINPASVQSVPKLTEEAKTAIDNFRVNLKVKEELQSALDTLSNSEDYQITTEMANAVDDLVMQNANLSVGKHGVSVSGNEAFGINITPAEWRKVRSVALHEMLGETYKNIKRWANQLVENFHRSWLELTTSTEVLETRLESLDALLDVVGQVREGCTEIELNELIVRSISKGGRILNGDLGKQLQGEVNYITSCLRVWEMEQIRYKNSVIRYFGNDKNNDITDIERQIPKLFNQRSKLPDDNSDMLFAKQTFGMLDGVVFQGITLSPAWVKDNVIVPQDNTLYADSLSMTGYRVVKDGAERSGKATVKVLSLTQIFIIRDVIQSIIDKLKSMNQESDPVNFNPDDVKDVLSTLRQANSGQDRAYQYGLITADYQYDVNHFKTQVSNMLIVLASHLITMLSLHLECYNVE